MRPGVRQRLAVSALMVLCAAIALFPGDAGAQAPGLAWTDLMPAIPSDPQKQHPVRGCRPANLHCVTVQVRRLRERQESLGCDHRAVFTTTYLVLTQELRRALRNDPDFFRFPKYFFREDVLFANVFFRVARAWDRGEPVPDAWRIAYEEAADGDASGGQDMLMGINAHVQNDMPFVLASLGLRNVDGVSRKPDHDKANRVLAAAYERVVLHVRRRYDPILSLTNPDWMPIDDVAGLEVVRGWREQVWRNAERLRAADTNAERARVARQIEANAAVQAELIAAPQQPGYRATRDAYCRQQLGG